MKSRISIAAVNMLASLAIAALLLLPFSAPFAPVHAAASTQITHAVLCAPDVAGGVQGPRQVKNTSSATGGTYNLSSSGCALMNGSDVGFFLSQGYSYGPNSFTLRAEGVTGTSTASISTGLVLPAYGYIVGFILCETAGNAVTGGLNIGDAGSATRIASAVALAANACVTIADSALTRQVTLSGVPTAETVLLAAVTSWNSAVVNVTILYSYF